MIFMNIARKMLVAVVVTASVAIVSLCAWGAGVAGAAEGYGEVARFGGYDSTGKTLGKFVYPVGFAVDPSDGNAVYVLDRIVSEESGPEDTLQYRLQKLSDTGAPLASVVLPPEHYKNPYTKEGAQPLVSLAVDSSQHRVYALVQRIVNDGEVQQGAPVVERLVAWSTEPKGTELVKAPGFKETDSLTGAALVAGPTVLEPAEVGKDLYQPQALTVDGAHSVVIEAQQGVEPGPTGGPMLLQQVAIGGPEGEKVGALGERFTAESTIAPENQIGDGLFTQQNGSLGLAMWSGEDAVSRLATVQASLATKPEPKIIAEDTSNGKNRDQAPSVDGEYAIAFQGQADSSLVLESFAAGSPVTQLTNGLYAARYGEDFSRQGESYPGNTFTKQPFWYQSNPVFKSVAREGVRLFSADGTIVTTLGAEKEGEPCAIPFARAALAAGANETVFVLTESNLEHENKGDEVLELGPVNEAAKRCPTDTRGLEVNKEVANAVTVTAGVKVPFAVKLSNPGADTPFEFVWNFGDGSAPETKKMEKATGYLWPAPSIEHQYATPGIVHASVKIYGAFGTSEVAPVEITVSPATPPTAEFSSPGGPAEEAVRFDASKSGAPAGTHIERYEWNFGDGQEHSAPNEIETHKYAKPGTYTVTLKVYVLGRTSMPMSHPVVITESAAEKAEREARELVEREAREKAEREAREKAEREAHSGGGTTTTPTTTLVTPPVVPVVKPKPLTNAQKLANALKICRKEPKKRRSSCERRAERQYGPKRHKAKKKR